MHKPWEESTFPLAVAGDQGDVLFISSVPERLTDGSSLGRINHLFVQDVECGMAMSRQILGEAQRGSVALGKEDLTLQGGTH